MTTYRHSMAAPIVAFVIALSLVACAATSLKDSWRDPKYNGPPLKKVLVVGVAKQPAARRTFEDGFVKRLKAAGVDSVASYNFIPQEGQVEEAVVNKAVQQAGAEGVLITRLVRVDVNTQVVPAYPAAAGLGFYGGYAGAWGGYYEPATVVQTDTVVLETSLHGVKDSALLWSGTTETFAPTSIQDNIDGFASLIIGALKKQKLI